MANTAEQAVTVNAADVAVTVNAADEELLSALECPVCFEPSAPLYMCLNGHNVCLDCRSDLDSCPVCRNPGKLKIHNLILDKISEKVLPVSCKNKLNGCKMKRRTESSLKRHYDVCEFGYQCKLITVVCEFNGNPTALYEHVKMKHPDYISSLNTPLVEDFSEKSRLYHEVFKWNDNPEYFISYFEYVPSQKIYRLYVRYVGPKKEAAKFQVNLMVTSEDKTSTIIKCVKQPLYINEDYNSNNNTVTFGEEYFKSDPNGVTKILLTVGPISKMN